MRQAKIRVGIIGAGNIVKQRHLPNLMANTRVEIAVVCNRRIETTAEIAKAYGIPEIATNWEEVIIRPDLDVIWIGTTPHLHAPISIAALEAGKHVFCQARMAMNLAEAREMLEVSQAHPKQIAMLCPPPNGMKYGKYFFKLLKENYIGQPIHFSLNSLNAAWCDPAAPAHWRQRVELSGNNILSVGIYAEVLNNFIGQPLSVCAQGRVVAQAREGYIVKIPDFLQVLGVWPHQIYGCLEWSGVAQIAPKDTLRIYGTEGVLIYDFVNDDILAGRRGSNALDSIQIPKEYEKEWTVEEDFIKAVKNGGKPEPGFETGVRYMQVVEAINCSLRENRWVELSTI